MRFAVALGIRPGEGRLVTLLAALFATVEAGRGLGEVAADTLFLNRFGAESLPYLFVILGMVSLVVALGYGAGIGRLDRRRFLVLLLAGLAVVLLVERVAVLSGSAIVMPILWVSVYALGAILLTLVWTVAGGTLDVRQAKRLFPLCTGAAILGGFSGTLSAGPLARLIGTENLILLYAALLVAAAGLTAATLSGPTRPAPRHVTGSLATELRVGFDYVRQSPLMRLVAVAYVLFAVLLFSVSFPFLRAMGEAFDSEADLATALGLLSAAVTGASFLLSVVVANRLYARVGLMGAALLLPLVYLAGFGLWLVAFSLTTAIIVRFAQQVTQRGISNAAWSALYNVVPAGRRPQVLAFMDGVPGQLGISLSGILLLVVGAVMAPTQIFVMGALAAVICVWVLLRLRARYGQALLATLRGALAEQVLEGGPGLAALGREPRVLEELRRGLGDADPGSRRLAADLMGRLGTRDDVGALAAVLDDADPSVRLTAIRSIAALDAGRIAEHAQALADDPSPAVRAELAVAIAAAGDEPSGRAILDALLASDAAEDRVAALDGLAQLGGHDCMVAGRAAYRDSRPRVRAAAVRALGVVDEGTDEPTVLLLSALDDEAPGVRRAASAALRQRRDATPALLRTLRDGSERAQEGALAALDASLDEARDAVRAWALAQVERATTLRSRSLPGDSPPGTSGEFLAFVLRQRERRIERRLLAAIAVLGAPEADGPIRRALRSNDAELRAQAVEALDALGDARLARAVVRLLDSEPRDRPSGDVLAELQDDPDSWIRGLALRTLHEREPDARPMITTRLASEGDPIVQLALATEPEAGGDRMADSERTLGDIERMLFLRRVSLFSQLDPEDLQRIASSATERIYAPGEALVREGELGDELVVIVEGDVSVVQGAGDAARLIRTYQAGDHIGELAVLRERPRAATVIAGEQGVRGLVIGGEGLMAILRERPEAAMAMLATLADRISTQ